MNINDFNRVLSDPSFTGSIIKPIIDKAKDDVVKEAPKVAATTLEVLKQLAEEILKSL